MRIFVNFGENG